MGTIEQGVRQAIDNCLRIQPGERVVIITDRETREIGDALRVAAEKIVGDMTFFVMEDFGPRPIEFPEAMAESLKDADVSIYAAQGAEGEFQTFRKHLVEVVEANPELRHAHMIGITAEIMRDGMCSDYGEIQRVSRWVYEKVKDAKVIRVATENGSDFTGRFSPDLKWLISDGDIQPGRWKNLPDGEVFTSPATLDGQVVIDGCLGDYFTEKYGSLTETPVVVEVREGRAVRESLHCDNEPLRRELDKYVFETDENSSRVGEFAIGTNTGLTRLIYNLLQDEKFPGIHIAFGSPIPHKTGAKWDSAAHVDGVLIAPSIYVDGHTLMDQGQFCFD